jgi:hypothetical protein
LRKKKKKIKRDKGRSVELSRCGRDVLDIKNEKKKRKVCGGD